MSLTTLQVLAAALALAGAKPLPAIDPPLVGRPDGFSNIVGKYQIAVSAEPTEVHVEEPITLQVRIIGSGPKKYEPDRKHIRNIFPAWDDDFYVQEMRDEHRVLSDQKTWLFVYRLKPKHTGVKEIDGIKLVYFDPAVPGLPKQKFVTRTAAAIPISVLPRRAAPPEVVVPPAVPDSFFEQAAAGEVLRQTPIARMQAEMVVGILIGVPLFCLSLIIAVYLPGRRGRRSGALSEAATRAIADLRAGFESPWNAVSRYLRERLRFDVADATPREAARFLKKRGFALERCALSEEFLQACDAVRFTPPITASQELVEKAVYVIEALEADPCAR